MNLAHVSTRELLETLRRRGERAKSAGQQDAEHLEADAAHLLACLPVALLDYPYTLPPMEKTS